MLLPFLINSINIACADPEIFNRRGPTKMVIFGHRRGWDQPPKNPEITFFKFQGGSRMYCVARVFMQ